MGGMGAAARQLSLHQPEGSHHGRADSPGGRNCPGAGGRTVVETGGWKHPGNSKSASSESRSRRRRMVTARNPTLEAAPDRRWATDEPAAVHPQSSGVPSSAAAAFTNAEQSPASCGALFRVRRGHSVRTDARTFRGRLAGRPFVAPHWIPGTNYWSAFRCNPL
jgi:hypothetical protein